MGQGENPHPVVFGPADVRFVCDACGGEFPGLPVVVGDPLGRLGRVEIRWCAWCLMGAADEVWERITGYRRDRRAERKQEVRAELLELLGAGKPLTCTEIERGVSCGHRLRAEVVDELVAEGVVEVQTVRRGRFQAKLHCLVREPDGLVASAAGEGDG